MSESEPFDQHVISHTENLAVESVQVAEISRGPSLRRRVYKWGGRIGAVVGIGLGTYAGLGENTHYETQKLEPLAVNVTCATNIENLHDQFGDAAFNRPDECTQDFINDQFIGATDRFQGNTYGREIKDYGQIKIDAQSAFDKADDEQGKVVGIRVARDIIGGLVGGWLVGIGVVGAGDFAVQSRGKRKNRQPDEQENQNTEDDRTRRQRVEDRMTRVGGSEDSVT